MDERREAVIKRALEDLQAQKFGSVAEAAREYGLPTSTLYHRHKGRGNRVVSHAHSQLLTPEEENVLADWVREQDSQGCPPSVEQLEGKVISILELRNDPGTSLHVGVNWTRTFLRRHPELRASHARALERHRQLKHSRSGTATDGNWHMEEPQHGSPLSILQREGSMESILGGESEITPGSPMPIQKAPTASGDAMIRILLLERENEAVRQALKKRKSQPRRGQRVIS